MVLEQCIDYFEHLLLKIPKAFNFNYQLEKQKLKLLTLLFE